ncbi:MAG: tetratricopeptide repeat protein [Lachnospiraceae bacterium]
MNCYNCGCPLTSHDFCTNCRKDVSRYKKILSASNIYYNEGLEKANVRDLSGAIDSLRHCVKLNKNHVEARNLLGLIYFEIGETVQALNEWVISKNLRSNKNIADDYLSMLQSNPARLESMNQTIKKYNQSLRYCYQGSLDLAIIQLKKVVSLNPKYLQARQLLALVYLITNEWEKAKRELEKARAIDHNNTITLRYIKEVDSYFAEHDNNEKQKNKPKQKNTVNRSNISEDAYQYQSGNETIIQPNISYEPNNAKSLLYIFIGLVLGIAAAWFLILPARIQTIRSGIDEEMRAISEQLDERTATVKSLEQSVSLLEREKTSMEEKLAAYTSEDGGFQGIDNLMLAANLYMENPEKIEEIGTYLEGVNAEFSESSSEAFVTLYNTLIKKVGSSLGPIYYEKGAEFLQNEEYEEAIRVLTLSKRFEPNNSDLLFDIATAYKKVGNSEDAILAYEEIIERFPNTSRANNAQRFIDELKE